MREIKFRGRVNDQWWYVSAGDDGVCDEWEQFWAIVDRKTVGQFTGLHDAYKQEIYEGDILAYDQNFRDQIAGYVEWRCNRWDIKTSTGTIELTGGASLYCVIGNIYEHSELLTRVLYSS